MRISGWLYRGPKAWLVWMSLLVSFIAVMPAVLELLVWVVSKHRIVAGDTQTLVGGIALLLLFGISAATYWVCTPLLILACILLLSQRVPLRIRALTASLDVGACVVLFWTLRLLKIQFAHGF